MSDFLHTTLGPGGPPVCRLGLSASYRPGERTVRRALDEGVNYFFCYGIDSQMIRVLRDLPASERERIRIATGAYTYAFFGYQNLRKTLEKRLRQLRTDYIDVFHFLGVTNRGMFPESARAELQQLRNDPRVRAVALSCHDRKFAGELAAAGAVDTVMIRYNAAHRGAEDEIFPHTGRVGVVSYTATRWTYLTRRPKGWPASRPVATAGQCYRFVLSNPEVDVCLTAPRNEREFTENLLAVRMGPLDGDEMAFLREFGDAVHRSAGWFW